MTKQFKPDDEYRRRLKVRNRVLGIILFAFSILFFAIALARMGGQG